VLSGEKILITGAGGMVAFPIAEFLARNNQVCGVSRFGNMAQRDRLDALGITTRSIDLAGGDLSALPDDFTYVLHLAWMRAGADQFDQAIRANAEGLGFVLQHCHKAKAALVVSSAAIYSANDDPWHKYVESDSLGYMYAPWAPTSPVSKVAQEAVARFCARAFNLPVTIVRLNTVYGASVGLPGMNIDAVVAGQTVSVVSDPNPHSPIHSDDMNDQLEPLLGAASVPATIINWAGDEVITAQDWCAYAAELAGGGTRAKVVATKVPGAAPGCAADVTRRQAITGPCRVPFKDGFRRLFESRRLARGA
jgi:nucleoside-diphosphate-sugar epimerase